MSKSLPLHCRCGWRQRLLSRPVEQSPAGGLIYLTRWRAISLDFVALWTSFCLAILLRSSAERKSNQIQKIRSIHRNLRLQNIDSGNSPFGIDKLITCSLIRLNCLFSLRLDFNLAFRRARLWLTVLFTHFIKLINFKDLTPLLFGFVPPY